MRWPVVACARLVRCACSTEMLQPLDRPHRLQAIIAGELHDPHEKWPMHPIGREEYERLVDALGDDVRVKRDLSKEPPLW